LGIFLYRVVTYSLNDGQINTTIAKYRVGKLKIKNYYPQFVLADPEDITVINIPWDIVQMTFLELPPTKKERDRIRAAELEIRRIYNLSEDLVVSCVPSAFGKCLVFFLKNLISSDSLVHTISILYPTWLIQTFLPNS